MPDDTTLAGQQTLLGTHNTVILVIAANLLLTLIKNQEVMDQIQKPSLVEHSKEGAVQFVGDGSTDFFNMNIHLMAFLGILCKTILLPLQIILLRGFDSSVAQTLAVITGHAELHRGEERRNKHLPLIGQVLANAIGNRNRTFLQFDNRHSNAVQKNDQIGAFFIVRNNGDLFGNVKEVFAGSFPVNEIYRCLIFIGILFYLGTVFQKPIDLPIGCVQTILQIGGGFDQFLHRPYGNGLGIAMIGQPCNQLLFIDITVFPVFQIADIVIPQLGLEKIHHALLGGDFRPSHTIHYASSLSISLIRPVSSSLIMPDFIIRYLLSFSLKTSISESISARTVAIDICSSIV